MHMSFLNRALKNTVNRTISNAVQQAVNTQVEQAVAEAAQQQQNQPAEQPAYAGNTGNGGETQMASDIFGALGGLMGGLSKSGLLPQNDPAVKLLNLQNELSTLQKQEQEVFVEIGRQAFGQNPDIWPQADKLRLIQSNIADAQQRLDAEKQAQEAAEAAERAAEEERRAAEDVNRCPACSAMNPEGTKFCQECGTKLGAIFCVSCGAELKPGARFCGECGASQQQE